MHFASTAVVIVVVGVLVVVVQMKARTRLQLLGTMFLLAAGLLMALEIHLRVRSEGLRPVQHLLFIGVLHNILLN